MTAEQRLVSEAAVNRGHRRPQLIALLQAISSGSRNLSVADFDRDSIGWAIESGLGPLFYRAAKDNPENWHSSYWPALKSADLTARVITEIQREALEELLASCANVLPPLTLIKGISLADEFYPESHLRLMRDMDVLVNRECLTEITAILKRLGYRQEGEPNWPYETHHHIEPFFHQAKNVWIEVHHALFPVRRRASKARVFQPDVIRAESRPAQFSGFEVWRLSPELQLVYVAAHWAQDLPTVGGMVAMVDIIFLLQQPLRWTWILDSVRDSIAASYLYLLLSYLARCGVTVISTDVLQELFSRQPAFGTLRLSAAYRILDRYCMRRADAGRLENKIVSVLWCALNAAGASCRGLGSPRFYLSTSRRSPVQ
jgi:Uncharacterised nucleotidyltransferase